MTRPIAILNAGHGYKGRDALYDSGAVHEGYREAPLVRVVGDLLEPMLTAQGVEVLRVDRGPYSLRDAVAIRAARDTESQALHVHLHINSSDPPGDYSAVFYDHRSSMGRLAADAIVPELGLLAGVSSCIVRKAEPTGWTSRAYRVLERTYDGPRNICGVLIESHFINHPRHQALNEAQGLKRIARRLSAGIARFLVPE